VLSSNWVVIWLYVRWATQPSKLSPSPSPTLPALATPTVRLMAPKTNVVSFPFAPIVDETDKATQSFMSIVTFPTASPNLDLYYLLPLKSTPNPGARRHQPGEPICRMPSGLPVLHPRGGNEFRYQTCHESLEKRKNQKTSNSDCHSNCNICPRCEQIHIVRSQYLGPTLPSQCRNSRIDQA